MIRTIKNPYNVQIYMAGDAAIARQVCREFARDTNLCVNFSEVDYIYKGGEESGFRVELIQYAKFEEESQFFMDNMAENLADTLLDRLYQKSYTIMTPTKSIWKQSEDYPIVKA